MSLYESVRFETKFGWLEATAMSLDHVHVCQARDQDELMFRDRRYRFSGHLLLSDGSWIWDGTVSIHQPGSYPVQHAPPTHDAIIRESVLAGWLGLLRQDPQLLVRAEAGRLDREIEKHDRMIDDNRRQLIELENKQLSLLAARAKLPVPLVGRIAP